MRRLIADFGPNTIEMPRQIQLPPLDGTNTQTQAFRIWSSFCLTTESGTRSTVPLSISSRRRLISASHFSSASKSTSTSRLFIRVAAKAALSLSESRSAWSKICCAVVFKQAFYSKDPLNQAACTSRGTDGRCASRPKIVAPGFVALSGFLNKVFELRRAQSFGKPQLRKRLQPSIAFKQVHPRSQTLICYA